MVCTPVDNMLYTISLKSASTFLPQDCTRPPPRTRSRVSPLRGKNSVHNRCPARDVGPVYLDNNIILAEAVIFTDMSITICGLFGNDRSRAKHSTNSFIGFPKETAPPARRNSAIQANRTKASASSLNPVGSCRTCLLPPNTSFDE